jgi:hypothetical protein
MEDVDVCVVENAYRKIILCLDVRASELHPDTADTYLVEELLVLLAPLL